MSNQKNEEGKDVFFNNTQLTLLDKAIKERNKGVIILANASTYNESEKSQFPIASILLDKHKTVKLLEYYTKGKR